MKFKKMEIYGFKSFADKVQINFNDGVTGIVGPNGCGKSNVADSIRWVLGEQSAKALRGSSMQDVIFNGTEKRKPQSFSEVTLVFDNTEKIFNLDYDEVSLSRKLYRSGDSEYAINKAPCRLKDITELLRGSGLGRDSYNIIGQGRIDELLSAKPEERRNVFEDAAGISKLKNRKTESVKKLTTANENLTRINDIIGELELQLGPLKEQAEVAKKYLELRDRLKLLDATNYCLQYDSSASKKQEIQDRLNGIVEEIELKTKEFNDCVQAYTDTSVNLQNIDEKIDKLRDTLLELTVGLEKQAGESRLLQEKVTTLTENKERTAKELGVKTEQLKTTEENLAVLSKEEASKNAELEELTKRINQDTADLSAVNDQIEALERTKLEENSKQIETLGKLGDTKAQIGSLKSETISLSSRIEEIDEEVKLNSEKVSSASIEKKVHDDALAELIKEENEIINTQKLEKQENLRLIYKISAIEEELKEYIAKFSSNNSKIKLLKAMQEENEGYNNSIKKLLTDSKTNASLGGSFINVVAKLMKVDEMYESAIDMALGASVQNVVTKNEDDAKRVIAYLKEHSLGRATFLPLNTLKPKFIQPEFKQVINRTPNVYGIASELVEFDNSYKIVFDYLLGNTVVVKNMDTAVALAKQTRFSFKIVTLDGDVITPSGTLSGGSKKVQAVSLLGREREIKELTEELDNLTREQEEKEEELLKCKRSREIYNQKMEGYETALNEIASKKLKETEFVTKLTASIDEANQIIEKAKQTRSDLSSKLAELNQKLAVYEKFSDSLSSGQPVAGINDPELMLKKSVQTEIVNRLTENKVKRAGLEGEMVSIDGQMLKLNDQKETIVKEIRQLKLELQQILTALQAMETEFSSKVDKKVYDQSILSLQQVRDEIAKADEDKKALNQQLTKLSEDKVLMSSALAFVNEKKFKEENALLKIDTDIETLQEKIWEDYGLTYASAKEIKLFGITLEEGLSESGKIKRQINSLGYVNVSAIEGLKDVSARYDDLSVQRDDLEKAVADLNGIIDSLTKEMEGTFVTEFNKINTNFQGVFRELFGGGRAELRLSDVTNPLECGIEIEAEPTGKKLQNITLLSGGERALTAIAILFAILMLKPMPFCVLDEIEAALDDANVERFAKYLKRFSGYTQFIVITHRKPTMELADSLYGVTMEERGVSKIVSVKLSDAIKNASPAK